MRIRKVKVVETVHHRIALALGWKLESAVGVPLGALRIWVKPHPVGEEIQEMIDSGETVLRPLEQRDEWVMIEGNVVSSGKMP